MIGFRGIIASFSILLSIARVRVTRMGSSANLRVIFTLPLV